MKRKVFAEGKAGQNGEESLRPPLRRLAIGSRVRVARPVTLRDSMGDQPSHRGTAGMVGAENLSEKIPERHERCEDPVLPDVPISVSACVTTSAESTFMNGKSPS